MTDEVCECCGEKTCDCARDGYFGGIVICDNCGYCDLHCQCAYDEQGNVIYNGMQF